MISGFENGTLFHGPVLVTGGTGFIGRFVTSRLSANGLKTIAPVRHMGSFDSSVVEVPIGNIGSQTDWLSCLSGVCTVVHLAARVHQIREPESYSLSAYRLVNVEGTRNLARQAAYAGVKHFIFLSSVKVYGECSLPNVPFDSESELSPVDAYGRSKMEAEAALREIERVTSMKVTIIRAPLVYGPGVGANFRELIRWVNSGVPLPLGALTKNARSLVSVENLTDLVATCVEHPRARGKTLLVSDGTDLSTVELIQQVAKALDKPVRLFSVPVSALRCIGHLSGNRLAVHRLTTSLQVDISRTRDQLGWTPPISLEQAIESAVKAPRP